MQNIYLSFFICIAAVFASPYVVHAKKKVADSAAASSTAITQEVLDAIATEMNRAKSRIDLAGAKKPYYIAYKVTEVDVSDIAASLGSTIAKRSRHFVSIEARVRVGAYSFDNSNFVIPEHESVDGLAQIQLPLEPTVAGTRRATWLVTDAAYKEALAQLRAKKDSGAQKEKSGSFTKQTPSAMEKNVIVHRLDPADNLESRAQKISASFRSQSHLRDSRVSFTSFLERRWYINSEGNNTRDTRRVTGVVLTATGQASDGADLQTFHSAYGGNASELPSDSKLRSIANKLSQQILDLAAASTIENYSGPVLFEGRGATDFVRHTLSRHLGGTPVPAGMSPQEARYFGGAFSGKIGLRILPKGFSIVDDPTTSRSTARTPVIGGFAFDDEGVPSKRVVVVKDGRLVSLLSSRTPSQDTPISNGHARRTGPGGVFHGSATNLTLRSRKSTSAKSLRRKLVAAVKKQGLPYGIIITHFDDTAITATPEFSKRELIRLLRTTDTTAPPPVAIAYKIFPNGKTELIRGVQIKPVDPKVWRTIIGSSRTTTTHNFLASGESFLLHKIQGTDEGFAPSAGIENSITSPNLLLEELDIGPYRVGYPKPALPKPE